MTLACPPQVSPDFALLEWRVGIRTSVLSLFSGQERALNRELVFGVEAESSQKGWG
jgi:hypothetical protein